MTPWYGFDLDGTLAVYNGWVGPEHIGEPVPLMVDRVKKLLAEGKEVRIFTARIAGVRQDIAPEQNIKLIQDWTEKHIGVRLPVTCTKDFGMIELYDDRVKQVIPNTGRLTEDMAAEATKEAVKWENSYYKQQKYYENIIALRDI